MKKTTDDINDDINTEIETKVTDLEIKVEEINNKYLRSLADYQNLEKQTAIWREDFVKFSNGVLIKQILEVVDDLEKACEHLADDGLKIILDKLKNILKNTGLEEISVEGLEFNPEQMEVISVEPGEENNKVAKVLQKGYILNGRIIRPAKVIIWVKS